MQLGRTPFHDLRRALPLALVTPLLPLLACAGPSGEMKVATPPGELPALILPGDLLSDGTKPAEPSSRSGRSEVRSRDSSESSVAVTTGALALAGGVGLFFLRNQRNDEIDDIDAMLAMTQDDPTREQLNADKTDKTESAKNLYVGGYILTIYGGLALIYSGLYLSKVIRQRKAKKLALRPTGSGVAVAF